ncbi:MAG: AAA family ATPase [Candidatus Lokiarchaeota archaeon]|nr:AAA family ATPase [Candidatus Lokiarchaeota archaeon]
MVFTEAEIRKRMQKYGTVYFPKDIRDKDEDLIGIERNKEILEDFFSSLEKYKEYAIKLQEVRITPSITVLLYGPPGTGKTSLTRALAKKYDVPMCIVDADKLVSPLLGDTLKNMRNVFELAAEIAKENRVFLLFFDELDAIASERSNVHEVGEIKRGVISFLQIIDRIDYEGIPLAIFGATNHQNQLDSAVWRRFTYHIWFGFPNLSVRKEIIIKFLHRLEKAPIEVESSIYRRLENEEKQLLIKFEEMKKKSRNLTLLDFEDKQKSETGLLSITRGYTGADIERAIRVSLLKAIQKEILEYQDLIYAMQFVGGTRSHVEQQSKLSGEGTENPSAKKMTSSTASTSKKPREI